MLTPNDGSRPSRFALDRYATGEMDPDEREDLEARLDERGRAHLAELGRARAELPPLDLASRRARAVVGAKPANNHRFFASVLAVAAAALLVVGLGLNHRDGGVIVKGEAFEVYERHGNQLAPWGKEPLGQGDVVGFKVTATGRDSVVVLSIDGTGALSVFWPEAGDDPEPITGEGLVPLPGTLTLDGAPGPEVFVAVYDRAVSDARAEAERAYRDGGADALLRWADEDPDVDAVAVPRR